MYFIKKSKFFNRKNRKRLYHKYETDYNNFVDLCASYEKALVLLDLTISKNILKPYIYAYLSDIRLDVADSRCQEISYTYQNYVDLSDIVVSVKDYENLFVKTEKLGRAVGKIYAALEFVSYLERRGLDFVVKEGD